jgi:hypothetical protein
LRPTFKTRKSTFDRFRFNSADFLKLGVSDAFVIDETNRNLPMKTRTTLTKLLPALTLASILSFCATIGADAAQVIHFNTSGDFANVNYSISDPTSNTTGFYNVNAQRAGARLSAE